jgi:hypothetical protein
MSHINSLDLLKSKIQLNLIGKDILPIGQGEMLYKNVLYWARHWINQ